MKILDTYRVKRKKNREEKESQRKENVKLNKLKSNLLKFLRDKANTHDEIIYYKQGYYYIKLEDGNSNDLKKKLKAADDIFVLFDEYKYSVHTFVSYSGGPGSTKYEEIEFILYVYPNNRWFLENEDVLDVSELGLI